MRDEADTWVEGKARIQRRRAYLAEVRLALRNLAQETMAVSRVGELASVSTLQARDAKRGRHVGRGEGADSET